MANLLQSLTDAFHSRAPGGNARVRQWRESALAQALRVGFPHNKLERWKHAPLRAMAAKSFAPETCTSGIDDSALPPAPRVVFVNGRYDAARSSIEGLSGVRISRLADALQDEDERASTLLGRAFDDIEAPFASLNTALADDGLLLDIDAGDSERPPLHMVFIGSHEAEGSHALRHRIECREGARLTVIEHHRGGGAALDNQFWHVHLKPGSRLVHVRLQTLDPRHIQFSRTDAAIAGDAQYVRLDVETGGHYVRHELNLNLQGRNATALSGGVLWAAGTCTLDTRLVSRHQAPGTASTLIWRGLADDRSRANFFGGIRIDAGADGSDAALTNKNLLLSEQAQINTQPALEIHADEVKAAHGATVGQIDAGALFYLRSRGVPEHEAMALLTRAFYAEALTVLDDDNLFAGLTPYLPVQLQPEGALS